MKCWIAVVIAMMLPIPVAGVPMVSIDMDPTLAGVQTAVTVDLGDSFSVDVVAEGILPSSPLNAFEFDLLYGGAILGATLLADGGFLLPPSLVIQSELGPPEVGFAALTLAPIGASGSGVLASISFIALGLGSIALTLNDVLLSAPFGLEIAGVVLNGASVRVQGASPVPEPALLSLLLVGVAAYGMRRRRGP
jgi:hypothetical protein